MENQKEKDIVKRIRARIPPQTKREARLTIDIVKRIREVLEHRGETVSELAVRMNMETATVRTLIDHDHGGRIETDGWGISASVDHAEDPEMIRELVRRWNAFPALVAKLSAYVNEVEEYGFIGVQGVSEDNENHYTGSPSYFEAKQLLNTLNQ